jgi:hypothetical protein
MFLLLLIEFLAYKSCSINSSYINWFLHLLLGAVFTLLTELYKVVTTVTMSEVKPKLQAFVRDKNYVLGADYAGPSVT